MIIISHIKYDDIVKERISLVTLFADALVYIIDDGNTEDNQLIIDKAIQSQLYEYIIEKYIDYPIVANTITGQHHQRYINPLFKIGFEVAESREKYKHAKNNGLLNIVGVSFDIIANWNEYITTVINDLQNE
ncbi:MAG: hypothetical protein PHN47_05695 [Clostridia bacterium]|jgi:hypothetical protein|nr:hypothetical protein [Clostridia bacterium]